MGMGHTQFTANSPKTNVEMLAEASLKAIAESNLEATDIQALFCGDVLGDFAEGQGM